MNALLNARIEDGPTVADFARHWLASKTFKPPIDAIRHVGSIAGVTLFRDGPFQVQLFIGAPCSTAPRHSHPNVDSIEVWVAGAVDFKSDTQSFTDGWLRVRPHEGHVANAGPTGGCFISIQKWLNGATPTSVDLDWDGEPIDATHAKELQ